MGRLAGFSLTGGKRTAMWEPGAAVGVTGFDTGISCTDFPLVIGVVIALVEITRMQGDEVCTVGPIRGLTTGLAGVNGFN